MRLIPNLDKRDSTGIVPKTCAVTNRGTDPEGFIDTHNVLNGWDRHVYISVAAVREMARQVGMVDPSESPAHGEAADELARLHRAVKELRTPEKVTV